MPTKLSQEQKTIQRQIATQQTIRLMQLLELPYASLNDEIQKEVDENPALEVYRDDEDDRLDAQDDVDVPEFDENGDPLDLSQNQLSDEDIFREDYYRDTDFDDYPSEREVENRIQRINAPESTDANYRSGVYCASLQEQWQWQLDEMPMTDRQSLIAHYLTGNLDDDGYFTMDLQAVVNELLYMNNIYTSVEEVEGILTNYVQELDPPGVGARNLQECLLIQLKRLPQQSEDIRRAIQILERCFDQFTKKHYDKICQMLFINEEQLKDALAVIRKLDPRPADSGSPIEKTADVIRPDFIITANNDNELTLTLNNQYVSKVRINKEFSNEYRFMTKDASQKKREKIEKIMREYVDKAEQFIGVLSTREMILYSTMYTIMQYQKAYFLSGDDADLKPMILKTIADKLELDVSTISRFSNSKYVQTDFGIIPVKHLFSEAVNDEDVSSKEIKRILTDLIKAEDKKSPLADEKLCDLLKERGYSIARRTVAKYREQLDIPVARLRKEI